MDLGDRRRRDQLEDLEPQTRDENEEQVDAESEEHSKAARGAQLRDGESHDETGPAADTSASQQDRETQDRDSTPVDARKESAATDGTQKGAEADRKEEPGKTGSSPDGARIPAKDALEGSKKAGTQVDGKAGSEAGKAGEKVEAKVSPSVGVKSGHGQKAESGSAPGGGGGALPRFDTTTAHDASVGQPLPSSFQHTEQVLDTAMKAAASPPIVSPETAAQPPAAQVGWAAKSAGFAGTVLHGTFIDKWSVLWDAKSRGGLAKQFQGVWSDLGKAKGWEKVVPSLDLAYDTVSTIGGFLGPLSAILGIVSYARYVPIPPIPAIGSALYVVSKVVKVINLILDVVKLAIAALRPVIDVIMITMTKNPEKRRKYQERLKQNSMDLALAGFTVAFKTLTDKGFKGGRAAARTAGKGRMGSLKAGFKGLWAGKTKDMKTGLDLVRSLPKGRAVGLFRGTVDDAWNKAILFRRLAYSQVSASRSAVMGATVNRSGSAMVAAQRQSVSALRTTVTGKGESMLRLASGTTSRATMRSTRVAALKVGSGGVTAVAGRSQSVTAATLRSSRHMDWSRVGETGKEAFASQVQGRLTRSVVKTAASNLGPAPQPTAPVAPGIEAGSEQAAKVTQKAVTDPATPVFKGVPDLPETTGTAPGQLEAIRQQREVVRSASKELEGDAASAKAGQVEAKTVMKEAVKHRQGAQNAKGEVDDHQQKLAQDKEGVLQDRQKVAKGKAGQSKGEQGLGKVKGEGDRAKGAVPGGRVNRDDIPWYKKVFLWVVDKFEGAKAKVTDSMTKAVTKAITGAAGLGEVGGRMDEADRQTQAQEQVLSSEPEALSQVAGAAVKEEQAATEGEQKASQNLAENIQSEQEAGKALQEAKSQESLLQKDEAKVQGDAAKFDSTYQKSLDHLNEQADAAKDGDLTPLDIRLNQEVAAIKAAVEKLIQAMGEHQGRMSDEAGRMSSEFRKKAEDLPEEKRSQAALRADELRSEADTQAEQSHSHRSQKAQELGSSADAYGGKAADGNAIQEVSKAHGSVVSMARAFDADKQSELEQMHASFMEEYDVLFG